MFEINEKYSLPAFDIKSVSTVRNLLEKKNRDLILSK